MDSNTKTYIHVIAIIVAGVVVSKLNPDIKEFFSSDLVVFIIVTLIAFETTKDIVASLAYATVATMLVKILTIEEMMNFLTEPFELLYPGPTSSSSCLNVKPSDLLDRFGGDSNLLKKEMTESGVPHNLYVSDANSPEIATYLINNAKVGYVTNECKLVK